MSGRIWCGIVAAGLAAVSVHSADATGFNITASDFQGGSTLTQGAFTLDESISISLHGDNVYADSDGDGLSDISFPFAYDTSIVLNNLFFVLHIDAGGITCYNGSGSLSSTFDWALTAYSEPVGGGLAQPLGSALYGYADFNAGSTVLHINESLLWGDGLSVPGWIGYQLPDLNAIALTQNDAGFQLQSVPAPGALCLLSAAALLSGSRRRRRAEHQTLSP